MGTLYSIGISSGDIGGAVAEAVLHDIRVNGLGLQGFPQIDVAHPAKDVFAISLRFNDHVHAFDISAAEAKRSVELMKSKRGHNSEIFKRVQEAAARLEGSAMRAPS